MSQITPILYLHGFASSPASSKATFFSRYLGKLGAGVQILDLEAGDFEHLTLTSQLQVLENAAAGRPVHLIGSSMGGYLAALFAHQHAEAQRLVLLAPAFGFVPRWSERLGAETLATWKANGTMDVFHYGENRPKPLNYRILEDGAHYPEYPDFSQKALIFHGLRDDVVPVEYSRHFAAMHPNAHLEVFDSGHDLLNVLEIMAAKAAAFLGLAQ